MCQHGFEKRKSRSGIVAEIPFRDFHRFAGFNQRSKVQNRRRTVISKERIEGRAVGDLPTNKLGFPGNCLRIALTKIVVDNDFLPAIQQHLDCRSTDVSGASGHKNSSDIEIHGRA